ncbi:hypothetical protein SAMN05192562_10129 [Kosakonia arachidis]|uniref:Uncharacterized protein n=1 Tax=Kosakonia arachidis TaxID=551989 RepID=A0A1I6XJW5_9ENTR|nr:hypothetical protein SAMN05192562_10129 [Kosakonia arachidis]
MFVSKSLNSSWRSFNQHIHPSTISDLSILSDYRAGSFAGTGQSINDAEVSVKFVAIHIQWIELLERILCTKNLTSFLNLFF